LRFVPDDAGGKGASGGSIASAIVPTRSRRSSDKPDPGATRGRGATQTVYVLQDGKPKAVAIKTGVSNGTMTEVLSGDLKPGMQVITGKLAPKTS
jgi:HlyD family secretion protein